MDTVYLSADGSLDHRVRLEPDDVLNHRCLRCSLTSEVPIRRGTTYVDSTRMGTFDGEVTEFVPPTRIAFRETLHWFGSPMTQARPEYTLEGDETTTIVHHVAVGELYGWMRFMKPAAAWMANRERTRTLNSLKRFLESG